MNEAYILTRKRNFGKFQNIRSMSHYFRLDALA